jgi:ABC-2 type transport system permease protein
VAIYDKKYRSFKGEVGGRFSRIWTIFTAEFVFRMKNPWNIGLLVVTLFFGLLPSVILRDPVIFLVNTFVWSTIFTAVAGGDILSSDRKYNTVTLYFSRPVKKTDYFIGKVITAFTLIGLVTFIPCIIMMAIVYGAFGDDATLFTGDSYNVGRMVISLFITGFVWALLFSAISLFFSSLTKNRWFATAGIFSFIIFSEILAGLMAGMAHRDFGYISIINDLLRILTGIGDVDTAASYYQWEMALVYIAGLSVACLLVVYHQIKRMDMSE